MHLAENPVLSRPLAQNAPLKGVLLLSAHGRSLWGNHLGNILPAQKKELIHKLAKGAFEPNRAGNNKKAA